jgi:hypothetical protein
MATAITFNAKKRVTRATALQLTPYSTRQVPLRTGIPRPRTFSEAVEKRLSVKQANPHDPRTIVIAEPNSRLALGLLEDGKQIEVARFFTLPPGIWAHKTIPVEDATQIAEFLSTTAGNGSLMGRLTINGLLWGFKFALDGHSPHITPYIRTLKDTAENRRDIRGYRLADALLSWHEKAQSLENKEAMEAASLVLRSWVTSKPA